MQEATNAAEETKRATAEQNGRELAPNGRSLQESFDELEREFNVRDRCFPKWITEGRISRSDAKDRLERLAAALFWLRKVLDGELPF